MIVILEVTPKNGVRMRKIKPKRLLNKKLLSLLRELLKLKKNSKKSGAGGMVGRMGGWMDGWAVKPV